LLLSSSATILVFPTKHPQPMDFNNSLWSIHVPYFDRKILYPFSLNLFYTKRFKITFLYQR
jgi:hypothetical protein